MGVRQRYRGRIAGVGSSSGVRVVVGWWDESPFGAFADAMVETASGHRVLLAPSEEVAELVASTYTFDEVRLEPVAVVPRPSGGGWTVESPSLAVTVALGGRTALGRWLRLVPPGLAGSPAFATLADPVARVALRGVRTRGVARAGRREYYGATDVRAVTALAGTFDGADLGALRPVDPPCRFGFSSTPRRPSVTEVTTTIVTA
ncbi:hypothetical protein ACK8HX_07060 [Oryzobacter sp. R7]|uniref:hypothetical protein n=1 Tax=Oryzobacter faecalis TaxID=3388656 RepID=UPI00398D3D27